MNSPVKPCCDLCGEDIRSREICKIHVNEVLLAFPCALCLRCLDIILTNSERRNPKPRLPGPLFTPIPRYDYSLVNQLEQTPSEHPLLIENQLKALPPRKRKLINDTPGKKRVRKSRAKPKQLTSGETN